MIEVRYETPREKEGRITREEVDRNGDYILCYDNPDGKPGLDDKVAIPRERVIEILY